MNQAVRVVVQLYVKRLPNVIYVRTTETKTISVSSLK